MIPARASRRDAACGLLIRRDSRSAPPPPPTPTLPRKGEGEERLAFSAEDTVFFFALTGTLAASPYFFVPAYFS
jgi:hypothetical protein